MREVVGERGYAYATGDGQAADEGIPDTGSIGKYMIRFVIGEKNTVCLARNQRMFGEFG